MNEAEVRGRKRKVPCLNKNPILSNSKIFDLFSLFAIMIFFIYFTCLIFRNVKIGPGHLVVEKEEIKKPGVNF